ncbi:TfxG immunity protein against TfxA peptides [Actinoplanes sp. SE50]|uniref:TfxG immunity protein against TfxA peptide n=1 Tax=unclassified Actinoplanes TaxID=2626549 RepID=UPI00023EC7DA|nr:MULTISPECIES: TfxG immunity protein against TfxA peptide [unclassified Actinoplanes]AEV84730.1 Trifolitoxin immunity protein [Actinoplanes sp. SE50/110]ATO83122.1 TfxG immunity protein against TfxA peptides [Actinoplanes sp. SE50]SLM00529.1 TfxG immunity protein against TfxA peptide [Actinoplanes sp. SE50/110]
MTEKALPGGNITGAVLIDGVVHKPASPWTPTVHAFLRHLEAAGFDAAPRALGFDERGREMLSYLPGETIGGRVPWPAWVSSDAMLVQVGRWLRRVHDLTAGFVPPEGERWFVGGELRPGLVVGHQDASPLNAVVDGDRLAGFCDWDIASPSVPEWDVAFSALTWVPLAAPQDGTPLTEDDRRDRARRFHLLLDAYGYAEDRRAFATAVPQRARKQAAVIRHQAASGDPASTALLPIADLLDRSAADVDALPEGFWIKDRI